MKSIGVGLCFMNIVNTRQKVRVSIIVPVYNVAPYIADCLRSVMSQTYTDSMECLLVDDCGSDDSIAIAEQMIAEYKGPILFQILHHERNRGLSAARNTGTEASKGEYLYYLDSDDEITEDCIERLMDKVMEYPDVEMVQGNVCRHQINKTKVVYGKNPIVKMALTNEEVRKCFYQYGQMNVTVWNKLLKRDFLINNKMFCREGIIYEDQLWIFFLMKYLKRASFVSEITYHYKIRPQSITTGTDNQVRGYYLGILYHDIMNNLTPGYEKQECDYYASKIGNLFIRDSRKTLEIYETFLLCREKCKLLGSRTIRFRLAVNYILGQCRFGKYIWLFLSMLWRLVPHRS